ncbi:hypothetical protein QLX08_003201 [Tetragonisca angustula]|uniref:Uncharacterized protein n=1 Tax=Tetragonisca angustula TaxID=166442 RepID=A0AAW1A9Z2_9HYME
MVLERSHDFEGSEGGIGTGLNFSSQRIPASDYRYTVASGKVVAREEDHQLKKLKEEAKTCLTEPARRDYRPSSSA